MAESLEIFGHCNPRFAGVERAFARNFEDGLEIGASFAATVDGELVVDLWAGHADGAGRRPWERDTIVNVYSTTKAMAALCALMLVDRGLLELDAPVANYWPEFGAAGKQALPVRYLLSHSSGLAGFAEPIPVEALFDWDHTTGLLASQKPMWEPGERSGYHALTFGHLLGELVRRQTGRTLGTFFREEVAQPLGADFHIGLAAEHEPRVGEIVPPPAIDLASEVEPGSLAAKVLGNPPLTGDVANQRAWRAAEIPAANGQGNARAVARVTAAMANGGELNGVRLLTTATLEKALEEQCYGKDLVRGLPIRWGLGFGLTSREMPVGPNSRVLFWGGWGGSLVVIDLDERLSFSYVMNKMGSAPMGDPRPLRPAAALYRALSRPDSP